MDCNLVPMVLLKLNENIINYNCNVSVTRVLILKLSGS